MRKGQSGKISPSRQVAFAVLEEVANGAFASDALRAASAELSPRDAGLASQIVFGSLRRQNQLDYLIELYSGRGADSLDVKVLISLRTAIYQIRFLDRIPVHAAVNDSVEFIKQVKRPASGLTNAVLRKAIKDEINWPTQSLQYACPAWLLDRWTTHFGNEQAAAIAKAALDEPHRYIRGTAAGLETEPTDVPGCYRLLSPVSEATRLHDIGSQAIIPLLDLQPGHTYLDLCAAPGNKTLQALETPLKLAIACDISEKRLHAVLPGCPKVVLDATQPLPFSRTFQRIFIDAPCSGTGTLARNPEIKWRLQPQDLARFKHRQLSILHYAIRQLSGDGRLLYATCSLEDEETRQVAGQTLTANPGWSCEEHWRLPGRDLGDGFYAALFSRKC